MSWQLPYLGAHLALMVSWLAFRAWLAVVEGGGAAPRISWRMRVAVGRGILLASVLAAPVAAFLPRHRGFPEATRIWALVQREAQQADDAKGRPISAADHGGETKAASAVRTRLETFGAGALVLGVGLELGILACGIGRVRRIVRRGTAVRRIGRVTVLAQPDPAIPFALWTPQASVIALPQGMAARPDEWALALRHEGQHHRHGDPAWLWLIAALAPIFPLNPFARLWRRTFQDLHELACDEALLGRARLDPQAYGRCLISVAEAALTVRDQLFGTAGMAADTGGRRRSQTLLFRRIEMFSRHVKLGDDRRATARATRRALAGALGLVLSLGSLAYAAQGARPRPPLTLEEVRRIAGSIEASADFPIVANEAVVSRLNRAITDPQRAAFVKASLARMEMHRAMIEPQLTRLQFPKELLAVPLVESGYQNLPQEIVGAGMWQFVKGTARRYGLRVDAEADERLDLKKETDAAMRLLGDDKIRFGDWMLALAAYNQGEGAVDAAIRRGGSRDAWDLVAAGLLNDYIAFVTAGVILINRPDLLD